jgi:hypothetical protein
MTKTTKAGTIEKKARLGSTVKASLWVLSRRYKPISDKMRIAR